jgi:hypothetical protein
MSLPDRVNLDLRQRERDNDDAEEYFAMNRDSMIEEEVYRLEKSFSIDELREAISECSDAHMISLRTSLMEHDGGDCLLALSIIREAWIKQKATEIVENA